ncbi:hypothetical protein D3C72_2066430 [compost metagenome]
MCYCSELHGSLCDLTLPLEVWKYCDDDFPDGDDDPDAGHTSAADDYFQTYSCAEYALVANSALHCSLHSDRRHYSLRLHAGHSARN